MGTLLQASNEDVHRELALIMCFCWLGEISLLACWEHSGRNSAAG